MVLEIFGLLSTLLYLYLEIKQVRIMWIIGFISALIYIVVFYSSNLYASMGLQFYYLFVSVYGWVEWGKAEKILEAEHGRNLPEKKVIFLTKMSNKLLICSWLGFAIIFLIIRFLLKDFTDSPSPTIDTLIASLSILATYWLSKAYIYHWIIWIIVNSIGVVFYLQQGLYPTSLLFVAYTGAAIYGYIHWKKNSLVL